DLLRAHEDVDDRAVVEVHRVELGAHALLEERAAFFDLVGEDLEEVVVLQSLEDLLFVVVAEIARDVTSEAARGLRRLDGGHATTFRPVKLPRAALRCQRSSTIAPSRSTRGGSTLTSTKVEGGPPGDSPSRTKSTAARTLGSSAEVEATAGARVGL